MRRATLKLLLGLSTTFVAGAALPATKKPKIDRRLLGTWQSDKERTVALWKYKKDIEPEMHERFERIFGKFKLRFSETHIDTEFEETNDKVPYSVLATDSESVVIAWHEEKNISLQHIHFEEDAYYVLSGYNVEFYKRVAI